MGGKKKKGLSNKLAKMSDEDRARYMQHRAQIEEEAKRRKEQLISTYMKIKLKKEEAFTRLNIAKINEHWHQILRKIKIKELKTEIEELRLWITKVLEIKNSIIKRLMIEIEEAEEQYEFNLKYHLSHIDTFLDIYDDRHEYFENDYKKHRDEILIDARKELKYLVDKSINDEKYLKTILFGMEEKHKNFVSEMKSFRDLKLEDYTNSLRASHETMVAAYGQQMLILWRDINHILKDYLSRTTQRRHHYIELKHIDERNDAERCKNDKMIQKCTDLLNALNNEYEYLKEKNEYQIKDLKYMRQKVNTDFRVLKQNLTKTIKQDEKKLMNMTVISNNVLKQLENVIKNGMSIKKFVTCCSRLQYQDETIMRWAKFNGKLNTIENSIHEESISEENISPEEELDSYSETSTNSNNSSPKFQSPELISPKNIPPEYETFSKLDGMWWSFNRAEIERIQLKKEKLKLIAENKSMKKIIKNILRDAALETPLPKEICFPVYMDNNPEPMQTKKIDLHGLDFLVIDLQ